MLNKVINMNENTKKKIMKMHKKGMTNYAITKQLGLSQTGVKYVLDPKYREHMKQIIRKRYSKSISPQLNNTISSSDIAWLSQHRQSVEHRSRILKGIGVYAIYLIIVSAFASAFTAFIAAALIAINATSTLFLITVFSIALILAFVSVITPDKYAGEAFIGIISGFIVGIALALIVIL